MLTRLRVGSPTGVKMLTRLRVGSPTDVKRLARLRVSLYKWEINDKINRI